LLNTIKLSNLNHKANQTLYYRRTMELSAWAEKWLRP